MVRTGGFPCRLLGCTLSFQVTDHGSMAALHAASARRTEHEIADHQYHHVRLEDERPYTPLRRARPKPTEGAS